MTDDRKTCEGFGPAPTSWEEVEKRALSDLWPGGREEFEEWLATLPQPEETDK